METRPNAERFATRYAPYVVELHEFFKSRGMRFGHSEDIVAFAADLGAKGSFHDEMMSMARAIIFREGGVVPRNEMLELILFAVSGTRTDETGSMDGSAGVLHEFVDEVMQSFRRRSFVEDDPEEEESAASPETLVTDSVPEEELPFVAARPVREVVVEEDWPMDAVAPKVAHPSSGAFARAKMRSEAEWGAKHAGETFDAAPAHRAELVAVERAPTPKPRDHFFRNAMVALVVCFAAVLLWRHRNPVPVAQEHRETSVPGSVAAPSALPGGVDERSGISSTTVARTTSQAGSGATSQPASGTRPAGDAVHPVGGGPPAAGAIAAAPITPVSPLPPAGAGTGIASPARVRRGARRAPSAGVAQTVNGGPLNATNHPGAFLVSSGMMDGNLISAPKPKYPKMAGMMGVEGQVILQAVVSSKGTVVAAHVLEGHHLLRGAAVHAVRGWRYRPYMVDGKATDVATIVIVDFHLPH